GSGMGRQSSTAGLAVRWAGGLRSPRDPNWTTCSPPSAVAVIPVPLSAPAPSTPGDMPAVLPWARRFYALHLLTIFGIALSNVFLGLTLLAAPFALRRIPIPWARLRPLYRPLGLYVLALAASIVASSAPRQ